MCLKKKITGAIMAILIFAIMTAGAAQANTVSEPNFAQMQSQAQQLPDFLANSGAVLMTDAEMAEVRGENVVYWGGQYFYVWFRAGKIIGYYLLD